MSLFQVSADLPPPPGAGTRPLRRDSAGESVMIVRVLDVTAAMMSAARAASCRFPALRGSQTGLALQTAPGQSSDAPNRRHVGHTPIVVYVSSSSLMFVCFVVVVVLKTFPPSEASLGLGRC